MKQGDWVMFHHGAAIWVVDGCVNGEVFLHRLSGNRFISANESRLFVLPVVA